MTEVLDSNRPLSALPDTDIYNIAEIVALDPALHCRLNEDNIKNIIDKSSTYPDGVSFADKAAFLRHTYTSMFCINRLMADQIGRSEFHIAGEASRICRVVRAIGFLEKITELDSLLACSNQKQSVEVWFPEGVIYPCPTIDGYSADDFRITPDKRGRIVHAKSMHCEWLGSLIRVILPTDQQLTLLEPPITLNSGIKVTARNPRFYRSLNSEPIYSNVPPLELATS